MPRTCPLKFELNLTLYKIMTYSGKKFYGHLVDIENNIFHIYTLQGLEESLDNYAQFFSSCLVAIGIFYFIHDFQI